jgi:hypothetical protein
MTQDQSNNSPQKVTFWIIWLSVLAGMFFILFFAAGGWPSGDETKSDSRMLISISLSGVLISTIIRWLILPRISSAQSLLSTMIIGLAFAESTGILGLFLIESDFPGTQKMMFIASIVGVLQYIPTYTLQIKEAK